MSGHHSTWRLSPRNKASFFFASRNMTFTSSTHSWNSLPKSSSVTARGCRQWKRCVFWAVGLPGLHPSCRTTTAEKAVQVLSRQNPHSTQAGRDGHAMESILWRDCAIVERCGCDARLWRLRQGMSAESPRGFETVEGSPGWGTSPLRQC